MTPVILATGTHVFFIIKQVRVRLHVRASAKPHKLITPFKKSCIKTY